MKKKIGLYAVFLVALCFFMLYRLDAYIMKPGSAYDVSKFVTVANNHSDEAGSMV
ncbi:endopeptidase La OS=Lysinibacillus sphaericus OX=1421 GN=LS41612_18455 PE=3 SV=1 [Lysinibacillus sphaericus]